MTPNGRRSCHCRARPTRAWAVAVLLWLPALAGCSEAVPAADAGAVATASAAADPATVSPAPAALPDDLPRTITLTPNADDLGAAVEAYLARENPGK